MVNVISYPAGGKLGAGEGEEVDPDAPDAPDPGKGSWAGGMLGAPIDPGGAALNISVSAPARSCFIIISLQDLRPSSASITINCYTFRGFFFTISFSFFLFLFFDCAGCILLSK